MRDPSLELVVGVGASAGGLEAFKRLLTALQPHRGLALLLVQHLDPNHDSLLRELLAPHTSMRVREADHGAALEPDTVYIIRPGTALAVRDGSLDVGPPTVERGVRLPIDHLFRSLAREYEARAVGIVLSGAGSDGSSGARAIKAAGGLVLAQEPDTCGQPGMPRATIAAGTADAIVPIPEIPAILDRFVQLPDPIESERPARGELRLEEVDLKRLTAILEAQRGFDLRVYKPATIERRALRRLTLSGSEDVASYLSQVRDDPDEQRHLIRDLLISVTDFFRDPESFRALRELVIDPLVSRTPDGGSIRVWVPGCATGEEAYSIAIEILEALRDRERRAHLQIFATDVDEDALGFARRGQYPASIAERMSPRRLETYFRPVEERGYRVKPTLRDAISFAVHDLTKDPPFSRMSLVSCRNVLIYLTAEAQRHVLAVLHFALVPEGHLFLSTSESTGAERERFSTVSKPHRIYGRVGTATSVPIPQRSRPRGERGLGTVRRSVPRRPAVSQARDVVIDALVPPTVIVNVDGVVTFTHGELSPFLQIPQGDRPRLELQEMLRPEIATRTRGAVLKCRRSGAPSMTVIGGGDEGRPKVLLGARPAPSLGDGAVILTFEVQPVDPDAAPASSRRGDSRTDVVVEQLEAELQATQEDLRNTVEELETSNEELRSAHEESMSMNEELQSANEELEATSEELRSLNEELTTVNAQLRDKVGELEAAHDDLGNFFASTKIATLFLDRRLRIKRFTPAARDLLNIGEADLRHFVGDVARPGLQHELVDEAKRVLDRLAPIERELRVDDRWLSRAVLPYRTESRRIEGVVVTFNDITALREANRDLREHSRRLDLAWEVAVGGVYEHRVPLDESTYHSPLWAQVLGLEQDALPGHDEFLDWLYARVHPDDVDRLQCAYRDFVDGRVLSYDVQLRLRHADGHWVWVRGVSKALERDADGRVTHVLGMMQDITAQKRTELALRESEARFRAMTDGLPLIVWVHDEIGSQEMVNRAFCEFFGVDRETMGGMRWQTLLHPDDAAEYVMRFEEALRDSTPFHAEARVRHADGSWRWLESWAQPRLASDGTRMGIVGTSADVTERRATTEALAETEQRFRLAKHAAALGIYDVDLRTGELRWDDRMCALWGFDDGCKGTPAILSERIHPDDRTAYSEALAAARSPGGTPTFSVELRVVAGEGKEPRWMAIDGIVTFSHGIAARLVATVQDITESKLADQRKDDYLAMLSHELRNPLSAIRSASELIRQSMDPDAVFDRAVGVLERQTGHMAKLLEGLLDISRISRGKLKADRRPMDLGDLLREVVDDRRDLARAKGITIEEQLPAGPLPVEADRDRLQQVFDNLLGNALKFTGSDGSVHVQATRDDDAIVVRVRDTGEGFSDALRESLFEPFQQGPQGIARASGGLGLGLALSKGLVELHGGAIEASSAGEGEGAEFTVRLPSGPEIPIAPSAEPTSLRGRVGALEVLVIEDNHDFAAMVEQVLTLAGHHIRVAYDAPAGLDAMREERPDVVLCDLGLPRGMSGFELARRVRKTPATQAIPLVAVSGYGRPEDKRQAIEAGFDAHLSKPVELAELTGVIHRVMMMKKTPPTSTEKVPT